MALNMLAIADGLAARFAPANVTPPTNPTTSVAYTNIRESTARLPNNLTAFPCVEVYPPAPGEGDMIIGGGQRRSTWPFTVRFYYGQSSGDLERDMVALYKWWSVLIDQVLLGYTLGGTATKALPTTTGIGVHEYGGVEYAVIEMTVEVTTEDTYTMAA
jgi:hypothetical protein